jgi:hypothetical protein
MVLTLKIIKRRNMHVNSLLSTKENLCIQMSTTSEQLLVEV